MLGKSAAERDAEANTSSMRLAFRIDDSPKVLVHFFWRGSLGLLRLHRQIAGIFLISFLCQYHPFISERSSLTRSNLLHQGQV